jgi:SAM-dependent methyltransferase
MRRGRLAARPSIALAALGRQRSALRWRAKQAAARLPFLFAKEFIYDDAFFDQEVAAQTMYGRLVDVLYELLKPSSVVDVGCGRGLILARFAEKGVRVRGIEGSRHAIARSQVGDRIVRANLERGVPLLGRFDLCVCIEVAEHLPERSARRLVEGLAALSDRVVFTAATPGQGGRHHVNEQPNSYWRSRFEEVGYVPSGLLQEIRSRIADIPEPPWMHANLMMFEKRAAAVDAARRSARMRRRECPLQRSSSTSFGNASSGRLAATTLLRRTDAPSSCGVPQRSMEPTVARGEAVPAHGCEYGRAVTGAIGLSELTRDTGRPIIGKR